MKLTKKTPLTLTGKKRKKPGPKPGWKRKVSSRKTQTRSAKKRKSVTQSSTLGAQTLRITNGAVTWEISSAM